MPDQVIPDVEAELERQAEEQMALIPDIEGGITADGSTDAAVANLQLNGAQLASMVQMVESVSKKEIPFESAVDLILIALPGITRDIVEKMLRPAIDFNALVPSSAVPASEADGKTTI
jgi:hypothetical protein